MPYRDPQNMPESGLYGGDSFSIEQLNDSRIFMMLRNGVDHGKIGREAIKKGNNILEEILACSVTDEDVKQKLERKDIFSNLNLLAYCLNELLIRRYQRESWISSTLVAGVEKDGTFNYSSCGDSFMFIIKSGDIFNEEHIPEKKICVGSASIPILLKSDETYYPNRYLNLNSGDKIIMCTDGIITGIPKHNFGLDKLKKTIRLYSHENPPNLIKSINKEVVKHNNGRKLKDDYTLLVLEKK